MPGIENSNIVVNLDQDAFTVSYQPELVELDDMYLAITELGYSPGLEAIQSSEQAGVKGAIPEPVFSALATAEAQNSLLFVDFYAEWCAACKVLEDRLLQSSNVQTALENYVFLKVDTDEFEEAAAYFDVVGMPTLLILDADGEEKFRSVGLVDSEELAAQLDQLSLK